MNGVKYVVNSFNKKIMGSQKVDATYASVTGTCPITCELRNNGCYSQLGPLGIHVNKLDKEVDNLSVLQIARAEAKAIDESYNGGLVPSGRCMRLHVTGDSRTIAGTRLINKAIGRWKNRGGGKVWAYTHCWDHITRDQWSNVEMLASVDSIDQIEYARQNGYAPAIVVSEHLSDKVYVIEGSNVKWIPCPAQVKEIGCTDCKICMNVDRLYKTNMGVAFSAHGVKKNQIKKRLTVIK